MIQRQLLLETAKYNVETVTSRNSDGSVASRAIIRHPGSVIVLPILGSGADRQVVLIRNFRITLERSIVELPAGTRAKPDANGQQEAPEVCAARELEEETGYRAGTLKHLTSWLTAPGLTDEVMHFFLATDLTHVGQHLEPDEMIQPYLVTVDRAIEMVGVGEITDAKTILALLWARRAGVL